MRIAFALLLVGCVQQQDPPPDPGPYYPPPGGGQPPPPTGTYGCQSDSECGTGQVCARTFACMSPTDVQTIHVVWTLEGAAASQTSCSTAANLEIDFSGNYADPWGYAPVPCVEGKFSIDKMPKVYTYVNLGRENDVTTGTGGRFDATTLTATLDLPY
jgi:hypothetical protein